VHESTHSLDTETSAPPNKQRRIDVNDNDPNPQLLVTETKAVESLSPPTATAPRTVVQKFSYDRDNHQRILWATYACLEAAATDGVSIHALQNVCEQGGGFIGPYYYQYEVRQISNSKLVNRPKLLVSIGRQFYVLHLWYTALYSSMVQQKMPTINRSHCEMCLSLFVSLSLSPSSSMYSYRSHPVRYNLLEEGHRSTMSSRIRYMVSI
jgi:hypothetical protein